MSYIRAVWAYQSWVEGTSVRGELEGCCRTTVSMQVWILLWLARTIEESQDEPLLLAGLSKPGLGFGDSAGAGVAATSVPSIT